MNTSSALHPVDCEIAVKFNSVCFSYGASCVLENVSFHIHRGEFVALVGPNGSGKTTLLKLLLGLEVPQAGNIELLCAARRTAGGRFDRIGFVPQQPPSDQAFPITVRDLVRMGLLRPLGGYTEEKAAIEDAMKQAGVDDLAQKPYKALSGGQRRRALVARALVSKPDILVLDEPTANMDDESETRLFETLGGLKGKTTILMVTHDTEFVSSLTDRVLCLAGGGQKGIVQHRIEAAGAGHGGSAGQEARVLHAEDIPANDCF
ncbi:MAG: metal ABC transporter ATP-binding protein [Treponema sp.]|nr:metal ABC transporter ATP-binding protein [Treponema sp.]